MRQIKNRRISLIDNYLHFIVAGCKERHRELPVGVGEGGLSNHLRERATKSNPGLVGYLLLSIIEAEDGCRHIFKSLVGQSIVDRHREP